MAGNRTGGLKAAAKVLAKDPNHYARIGALGGAAHNRGGFADDHDRASWAGRLGGLVSRRNHTYLYTKDGFHYYIKKSTGKTVKYEVQ